MMVVVVVVTQLVLIAAKEPGHLGKWLSEGHWKGLPPYWVNIYLD